MFHEPRVWMLAAWLATKHGAEAPQAVHARIMDMRCALADEDQSALWPTIDDAVSEWLRSRPRQSETIH